jgi:Protein of unknown function (DUF835)
MGNEDDLYRGYIKGYKEGLQRAWDELIKLTSKGYTPRELQIMVKSSQPILSQFVESKKAEIEKALGRKIFTEEKVDATKEPAAAPMSPGMSICFREDRPERGPSIVKELITRGSPLLSISRMHPDQLRTRFNFEGRMIWLTKSETPSDGKDPGEHIDFVSPNSLPLLADAIQQFLVNNSSGVIFLEGLEYLMTQNDFKGVLRFVQLISEQVQLRKGILILSANPTTMDPREFSLIEREMTQIA